MTTLKAYNIREVKRLHRFLAAWMQAERESKELSPEITRHMGMAISKLDDLFDKEDRRGMRGLNSIVKELKDMFLKDKEPREKKYYPNNDTKKPPYVAYDFERSGRRIRIPLMCTCIKPEESRVRKYAEWFFYGRDMEHARGMIVVKHPDAPVRPKDVPYKVFHVMSEEEKKAYKEAYYKKWEEYTEGWGDKNKETAKELVIQIESSFNVINAYPSHVIFGGMPLTAKSYMHTFIPHTDLERKVTEIRQNNYRFRSPYDAEEFLEYLVSILGDKLKVNEEFIKFLDEDVIPYDDIFLFRESRDEMCLVVRDKDVVSEIIAPVVPEEYESQMYYIARIALLKKKDHIVTWPSKEKAKLYMARRVNAKDGEIRKVLWAPKREGYFLKFGKNEYIILLDNNKIYESRWEETKGRGRKKDEEKEKDRILRKLSLYKRKSRDDVGGKKHYLDVINPLPSDLYKGWFVTDDTRYEVFESRHGMVKDPTATGIKSPDYFSHAKELPQYGKDYKYGGSINVDIIWVDGAKYEFQVVTPESLIENEVGRYARADYQRMKRDARENIRKIYFEKLSNLLGRPVQK